MRRAPDQGTFVRSLLRSAKTDAPRAGAKMRALAGVTDDARHASPAPLLLAATLVVTVASGFVGRPLSPADPPTMPAESAAMCAASVEASSGRCGETSGATGGGSSGGNARSWSGSGS